MSTSYDHLDWPTIHQIHKLKGTHIPFPAPLGLHSWFSIPAEQLTKPDWHGIMELHASDRHPHVRFICAPAQHTSGKAEV